MPRSPGSFSSSGIGSSPTSTCCPTWRSRPWSTGSRRSASRFFGYTEAAARLPSAVSALGGVFLAYGLGRALWGPGPGVLGALVLASAAGYVALGRILTLDMTFALCLNLGIGLGYLALSRGQARLWPWAYLALALAVLTKGPVALVLAGLVWVIWVMVSRRTWPAPHPNPVLGAAGGHHLAVVCLRAVALPGVFPVFYPGAAPGPVFDPGHPPRAPLLLRTRAPGAAAALDLAPPLDPCGRGPVAGPGLPVPGDLGGRDRGLFLPVPGKARALHPAGALTSGATGGTRPGPAHRGRPAVLQPPVAQNQPARLGRHGGGAGGAQSYGPRRLLVQALARANLSLPYLLTLSLVWALTPLAALIWRHLGALLLGALLLSALVPRGIDQVSLGRSFKDMGLALKSRWQPGAALVGVQLYSQGLSFYSGHIFHLLGCRTELDFGQRLGPEEGLCLADKGALPAFTAAHPVTFFFLKVHDLPWLAEGLPGKFRPVASHKDCILTAYEGK